MEANIYIVTEVDNDGRNDYVTHVVGAYSTMDNARMAIEKRMEWWFKEVDAEGSEYDCCNSPDRSCVRQWFEYMIQGNALDTYDIPENQQEDE